MVRVHADGECRGGGADRKDVGGVTDLQTPSTKTWQNRGRSCLKSGDLPRFRWESVDGGYNGFVTMSTIWSVRADACCGVTVR